MITKRILPAILATLLLSSSFPAGNGASRFSPDGNSKQPDQKTDEEGFKIKVNIDLVTTDITVAGEAAR